MKQLVLTLLMSLMLGMTVAAQGGLSGRWQGKTGGGHAVLLDLKASGARLTGTLTIDTDVVAITNGKVAKNTFSFTAPMRNKPSTFQGKIVGNQIGLTLQGAKNPVVLKRVQ